MSKISEKTKDLHARLSSILLEKGLLEETPEFSHEFAVTGRTHNEKAVMQALPYLIEKCEEAPSILFLKRYILKEGKLVYGWTFGSFGVTASIAHKHLETLIRAVSRVSIATESKAAAPIVSKPTAGVKGQTGFRLKVVEQTWDGKDGRDVVEIPLPHVTGMMGVDNGPKSKGVKPVRG